MQNRYIHDNNVSPARKNPDEHPEDYSPRIKHGIDNDRLPIISDAYNSGSSSNSRNV